MTQNEAIISLATKLPVGEKIAYEPIEKHPEEAEALKEIGVKFVYIWKYWNHCGGRKFVGVSLHNENKRVISQELVDVIRRRFV